MIRNAFGQNDDHGRGNQKSDVILIEPRSLTRQCLSPWLKQHDTTRSLYAFNTPSAAVDHQGTDVGLIIWSIGSASMTSALIQADLNQLKQCYPEVPVLVLADRDDPSDIRQAIRLGVKGYLLTSLDHGEALEVLRFVQAGGTYVPASAFFDAKEPIEAEKLDGEDQPLTRMFNGLTPREMDVVERIRQGKPNKIIAHELKISESTVKVFVHRILHKLGAVNRTEAAYLAQQRADMNGTPRPATSST